MRNLRIFHFVLLALFLPLVGCDSSRSRVVGKWKVVGDASDLVWEFSPNGTLSAGGSPGRYTLGDGHRIKIQTATATFVHQIEFAEDRMIWKENDGTKTELTKVK